MDQIKIPKKLIEVALPLDDINFACAHEKQPGIGAHPRGLHLWWARRPLPSARAVLFAQMVNDPGYERELGRGVNKKEAEKKREELFKIIQDLVKWENTNNEMVLRQAREAIWDSWRETCHLNRNHSKAAELFNPEKLPAFHDPFAGGGAIPLEAQRLGLEAYASDLNPVAVMINKTMIEIPPKFAGNSPIGPVPEGERKPDNTGGWTGAAGLAEDIRRYGYWVYHEALKRIGHLYPKIKITSEISQDREDLRSYVGQELTVIAWIWTRTVKSPNPAFSHVSVPLVRSFMLSSKKGKETWVKPVIDGDKYHFEIRTGKQPEGAFKGTVKRTGGTCILSKTAMPFTYIREEGKSGRMGQKLMAIVAQGKKGRVYLSPSFEAKKTENSDQPKWKPEHTLPVNPRDFKTPNYGLKTFGDLFTSRQLIAMTTFSDLVQKVRKKAISDAKATGMADDGVGVDLNGTGATAYGDALAVYLTFAIDRLADYNSTIATWKPSGEQVMQTFKRQAIPMTWDFPESNIMGKTSICWLKAVKYCSDNLFASCKMNKLIPGSAHQEDAATQKRSYNKVILTDPPYYDNIGYADLSDFFYVWMRRSLRSIYPSLFASIAVPKTEELVASPYRHGNKENAEAFFLQGMTQAIQNLAEYAHPAFPVSIYYAFKQAETKEGSTSSTGWETFLEAVFKAGFSIVGTWPLRTELANRMIGMGNNALASSIVLVCQKRSIQADSTSRRELQRELRQKMPEALETMIGGQTGQQTPITPVDLSQAAIGPGMAIFSKYQAVLNQDGSKMDVHDALILINREITEYLSPDAGNFDADTLFCSAWFEQYAWEAGIYGEADTLSRAKGTAVDSVKETNIIDSGGGKVRLLRWSEYPENWKPSEEKKTSIWQVCHHIIRILNQQGESEAGVILSTLPSFDEPVRQLAYHLYTLCERKKWAEDARIYNELIGSWHQIVKASLNTEPTAEQISF
jgi:putative DNA methylase